MVKLHLYLVVSGLFLPVLSLHHVMYPVIISEDHLKLDKLQNEVFEEMTLGQAMVFCAGRLWCTSVCQLAEKNFILTDLYVIREYLETESGNQLQCYTALWRKLLYPSPGSLITGSASTTDLRMANLADGIYNMGQQSCYKSDSKNFPYMTTYFEDSS